MKQSNKFIALGGGDQLGGSCYYLQIDDCRILLDCGNYRDKNKNNNLIDLLPEDIKEDFKKLDAIIISHAHEDHFGALFNNFANLKERIIFCTSTTKQLIKTKTQNFNSKSKNVLDSTMTIPYFNPFRCNKNKAEFMFLPAGHMEGAAMTLFFINGKSILYTGDFSFPLTNNRHDKRFLMKLIRNIDVLIIESTNNNYQEARESRHASVEELYQMVKITYPKKTFLVHQTNQREYTSPLAMKIELEYYTREVIETANGKIYNL